MEQVLLTAFGVGGATVIGAVVGFLFRNKAEKYSNMIMAFAAGVMLLAAVTGLIVPSLEFGGIRGLPVTAAGIFAGAFCVVIPEKMFPLLKNDGEKNGVLKRSAVLTVFAVALHNLPEGIAAGVGFGTGDTAKALFIAGGIALQNIPEGCVVIAPLIGIGVSPVKALGIAALTGLIEIIGTLTGFVAVNVSVTVLPFALAFAGGTMLYVIICEMLPGTVPGESRSKTLASFLAGFCVMLAVSTAIG